MEPPSGTVSNPGDNDVSTAIRPTEAGYLRLVEAQSVAKVGSWDTDLATGIVTWSTETYRIFNVNPGQFQPTHAAFIELVHPDDRTIVNDAFLASADSDQTHVIEHRIINPDGTVKFIEERWKAFKDEAGKPSRAVGTCRDITEQKQNEQEIARLSRLYAALSHVNQAITRMPGRDELFNKVCQALVTHGGFRMAWIGWHDAATNDLVPAASAGDVGGYLSGIKISVAPVPEGMGPAGMAFRSGKPFISNDSANDAAMLPWRERLKTQGYRSSVALCLRMQGEACGTLAVHADSKDFFHDKEIALLEEVAADVSFALDNIRREEARRDAEQNMRRELDFSNAVISSVPGVLYLYDEKMRLLRWNKNFGHVTGYTDEEIAAMQPLDFISAGDRAFVTEKIREVFDKGASYATADFAHKDGRLTPYYFTGTRAEIENQPCLVAVGIDLTERKKAEAAKQRMEQSYQTLFEYAPEGIVICDSKGYYIDANPSICSMLGYSRAEMTGKHSSEIVAPEEVPQIEAAIEQIISTAEHRREWKFRRKDGTMFLAEVVATQLPDGVLVAMIRDLTDRHRADTERENYLRAEAADRVKSAFLASMSHELRTPLNSIIGFTGIILQRLAGPLSDEQAKQLEMVRGSARHLLTLISDLLDISKIEAGQLSVNRMPFDISSAIAKALDTVRPLAENKGLRLEAGIMPDIGQAIGDEGRFQQILLNLLSNAIKFTDQGQVMLTAKLAHDLATVQDAAPHGVLRIRISDTGIGINPEDMALLFQPFRQLDTQLSRRHEGTGLGLSICLNLAHLMGGAIRAESVLGQGSTFTLTLPLNLGVS